MNRYFAVIFLLVGLIFFASAYWLSQKKPTRPNVLFIVIDTLRADRLHGTRSGIPIMPYLSEFADEAVEYGHAVSPCSWTRPAMASIFTAREVDAHRVFFSNAEGPSDVLASGWETMAEYLATYGYDTIGYQSNGNLHTSFGFDQGFAEGRYTFKQEATANEVTDHLLGKLDKLDAPFFMYAHYQDPHVHYEPPEEHRDVFGPLPEIAPEDTAVFETRDSFMEFYMERVELYLRLKSEAKIPMLQPSSQEYVKTLYDGECHFSDAEVGKLIDIVRTQYPDTLIVILSDHGEEFWERGGMGHGTTLYEEQAVVPLLIQGPEITPRKIEETVSTVGLLPTIASYLGLPERQGWQGENLLAPKGVAVHTRTYSSFKRHNVDKAAIYDGTGIKLIEDNTFDTVELFDLEEDPEERNDLSSSRQETKEGTLEALHRTLERDAAHYEIFGGHREQVIMTPELEEALEKGGYGSSEQGDKEGIDSVSEGE